MCGLVKILSVLKSILKDNDMDLYNDQRLKGGGVHYDIFPN